MSILDQVQRIFRDVFDDEHLELKETMSAKDIEDWDSLTHIQLVSKIEKHFNVRFSVAEITHMKQVKDLLHLIESKRQ